MAGRDDFGSGSKSPGGWGGSGGGGFGGGGGAKSSGSIYNYSSGAGQRGSAIGNWNTGGQVVARGNQFGTIGMGENNLGKGPWPGGYAQPVLQGLLGPVVPRPPVTQETIPGVIEPEVAPMSWDQMIAGVGPGMNNPFTRAYPPNPGGQFGPRTYNDGYQTMRSDKFQNNPAYGSPGGGLGQYNRQTTMNMNGGPGGYHHGFGGPR